MLISSIAILVNPRAGNGKSIDIGKWLQNQLTTKSIHCQIFHDDWPVILTDFSDVWLIGGDGTINFFINQYSNCHLPITLFKGGTGDDFAWKLYGEKTIAEQFETALQGTPKYIDAGKCNERLFLNCVGVGFDGEIIRSMNAIRFLGGNIGYLLAVLLKIFSFKEYAFSVTSAEKEWNEPLLLLLIMNSSRAGGGFFVAPEASLTDGLLNMILCKKLPIWKRLRYLPVIKKGKHLHLPFVTECLGQSFSIGCEKEMFVQIDGELMKAEKLLIEVMPNKFLFRY